jgi:hypothetical protein
MESDKQKEESIDLSIFHPNDAEGIAALFRSVYGEEYPVRLVYNPEELIVAFERKENIPVVARTKDGRIAAHEALYRSSPNPQLYEAGQGLVLAELRGSGINGKINEYICEVVVPTLDMESIFGEAVCNHIYMQKAWSKFQTIETAIEVDLMPEEAYAVEASAKGRVATLLMFRNYREREQTIYLPKVYKDPLQFIYSALPDAQEFQGGHDELPSGPSNMKVQVFDFAKVARITVSKPGTDFKGALAQQEKALLDRGMIVFQLWLNLSWPFIDSVIEAARGQGYFFGGLLPRWFGTDGILMQKVMQLPNWEGIHLYSERAKKILDLVRADWSNTL